MNKWLEFPMRSFNGISYLCLLVLTIFFQSFGNDVLDSLEAEASFVIDSSDAELFDTASSEFVTSTDTLSADTSNFTDDTASLGGDFREVKLSTEDNIGDNTLEGIVATKKVIVLNSVKSIFRRCIVTCKNNNFIRSVAKNLTSIIIVLSVVIAIILSVLFYRKRKDTQRFLTNTRLSVMDKEVRIACDYIETNFDDVELSIESICDQLVTGRAFLESLFYRELGMGLSEFINQVRINRAKMFLENNPELDVAELAYKSGFSESKQFEKVFKSIVNTSLEEYSKLLK